MTEQPLASATPETPSAELLARLDAVQARLERHAVSPPAAGLTDPDPPTGERWDWGQVWAHLGEFVPYWSSQVRLVLETEGEEPIPFGRTKKDPVRIAAIEADRRRPPAELMARLAAHLEELRALVRELSEEDWRRRGVHPTLGVLEMPAIFQEFLVGHLEAHVAQLDGLTGGGSGS
jgi:DinB family protein